MGILDQMFERRDASLSLKDYGQWLELGIVEQTASGVSVNPNKAMHLSAVFACTRILAETIASLPLIMYERLERGKRRAIDHQLYRVLKDQPNEAMTSFEFRETLQAHLPLWGNAYSAIMYGRGGQVEELLPLRPDCMLQIAPRNGRLAYQYQLPTGEIKWLDQDYVWHLRGLGSDGRIGYSVISMMRQAVGLGMAAEEFGARFFSNDATSGLVLSAPGPLTTEARKNMRESWEAAHQGLSKKHRVAILEQGVKAEKITIPPNDSQWLETRKFQIAEIARAFRVPLALLEEHDKAATYASVEQFMLSFVVHTIRPWLVRWEQSIKQNLMLEKDRERYFPEHLVDALLRGDVTSRYAAYAIGRQWGWYSADDIRELENMNPIPGKGGEIYLVPLNMVPSTQTREGSNADGAARALPEAREKRLEQVVAYRLRLARGYMEPFREAAARVIHRETDEVRNAMKEILPAGSPADLGILVDRLARFYRDRSFLKNEIAAVLQGYAAQVIGAAREETGAEALAPAIVEEFLRAYIRMYAARHVHASEDQIKNLLPEYPTASADVQNAIERQLDEWEATRPGAIALEETVRSSNALAKLVYVRSGFPAVRWNYTGHPSAYCEGLDGMVVRIGEDFVRAGEAYQACGESEPLTFVSGVGHPPLVSGCDCMITAEAYPPGVAT